MKHAGRSRRGASRHGRGKRRRRNEARLESRDEDPGQTGRAVRSSSGRSSERSRSPGTHRDELRLEEAAVGSPGRMIDIAKVRPSAVGRSQAPGGPFGDGTEPAAGIPLQTGLHRGFPDHHGEHRPPPDAPRHHGRPSAGGRGPTPSNRPPTATDSSGVGQRSGKPERSCGREQVDRLRATDRTAAMHDRTRVREDLVPGSELAGMGAL